MKKLIACILCILMVAALAGCGGGLTGDAAEVEKIEWSEYDELVNGSLQETDMEKRSLMMHKAEDLLMDSGAVIPLFYGNDYFLLKSDVTGVIKPIPGNLQFSRIAREGADPTEPIRICVCKEFDSLDSAGDVTADRGILYTNISAGLVTYDEDGEIICDLAESYEIAKDYQTYTFTLRDGLKWSDGTLLTAEDFVYSWKRIAASENGFIPSYLMEAIKGFPDDLDISASEDGKVFTVHLAFPCTYFLQTITFAPFCPVPRQQIEAYSNKADLFAWAAQAPLITCGPYTVEGWKHNESMTLKKNPYYYAADEIQTETVELMLSDDEASAYTAYVTGAVSLLYERVPLDILSGLQEDPEYHSSESLSTAFIVINVKNEIFKGMSAEDAATFRKALRYVIDRRFITDVAIKDGSVPATTYVSRNLQSGDGKFGELPEGYSYPCPEEEGYYSLTPDLPKAREMLRSIGFEFDEDGKLTEPVTVDFMTSSNATQEMVGACIQADLDQIGINMTVSTRESTVFYGERGNGDFDFAWYHWTVDYNDPYSMLEVFLTDSSNNDAFIGR